MWSHDTLPSLGTSMPPCRSSWEALTESFLVLPGGERRVEARPLDVDLRYGVDAAVMNATLKDRLWKLQVVVDIRKSVGDGVRRRRRQLQ